MGPLVTFSIDSPNISSYIAMISTRMEYGDIRYGPTDDDVDH